MNEPEQRRGAALSAFSLFSLAIRTALLSETTFAEDYGLPVDVTITISPAGPSLKLSAVCAAIRLLQKPAESREIQDNNGHSCSLTLVPTNLLAPIELQYQQRRFALVDYSGLLPDRELRLAAFEANVNEVNFPPESSAPWREILAARALSDREVLRLQDDLNDTPIRTAARIVGVLATGHVGAAAVVPATARYFERLVGAGVQSNVPDQADRNIRAHIEALLRWKPVKGLSFALMLGSHSLITHATPTSSLSDAQLNEIYDEVLNADRLSQLAALEVGLQALWDHEPLGARLISIAEQLRNDDPTEPTSGYRLISALFVLTESQLAITKTLADRPPFWRRCAALAHAALVARAVLAVPTVNRELFIAWAAETGQPEFYMQSLCDLRIEPRWLPQFSAPQQLKNEFLGRAVLTAQQLEPQLPAGLKNLIFGDAPDSLRGRMSFDEACLPGPLEGASIAPSDPPQEIADEIQKRFQPDMIEAKSFALLVNTSLIYRIDVTHAELAAKALRSVNYFLQSKDVGTDVYGLVNGLAHLATVTGSKNLADQVRILARRCRIDLPEKFPIMSLALIGLTAAGAMSDHGEWCRYLGDWLTELCFVCPNVEEAQALLSTLDMLCHKIPELWRFVGRGEAALLALIEK